MSKNTDLPKDAVEIDTSSTFFKWETPGDRVTGTVLRLELSKKYGEGNYILLMRDDDGKRIAVSAPLKVREAVQDNDLIGERIVIVYAGDTATKGGNVKEFKIGKLAPLGDAREF